MDTVRRFAPAGADVAALAAELGRMELAETRRHRNNARRVSVSSTWLPFRGQGIDVGAGGSEPADGIHRLHPVRSARGFPRYPGRSVRQTSVHTLLHDGRWSPRGYRPCRTGRRGLSAGWRTREEGSWLPSCLIPVPTAPGPLHVGSGGASARRHRTQCGGFSRIFSRSAGSGGTARPTCYRPGRRSRRSAPSPGRPRR